MMLHYDIHEDAEVVAKTHKTTAKEIWETMSTLLTVIISTSLITGLCSILARL